MGYFVIFNKDIKVLEKEVSEYIKKGCIICGGICYNPDQKIYLQSLTY